MKKLLRKLSISITHLSIKWKIIGITVGVVLLMRSAEYIYIHTVMVKELEKEFLTRSAVLVKNISYSITNPLLTENISVLSHILRETKAYNSDLLYIYLLKDKSKVLSHSFVNGFPIDLLNLDGMGVQWKKYKNLQYTYLSSNGKKIYHIKATLPVIKNVEIHIGFSRDYIRGVINEINYIFTGLTIFLFLIAVGISMYLSSKITKPLEEIVSATNAVSKGDFTKRVQINTGDELEILGTNFNRMVESLEKSRDELEKTFEKLLQTEKFVALGTLSAGLAHELNNPISGIYNCVKILKNRNLPEEKKEEYFRVIFEALDKAQNIIRRLLDYARKGDEEIREPINVRKFIKDSLLLVDSVASDHTLHFIDRLPPSGGRIYGDKEKLQEVLVNILLNAFHAIDGNPNGKITVEAYINNGKACIIIQDNGHGIPSEIKHRIFDPFFTTKPAGMGTGLGLTLSLRTVEKHGGELHVDSVEKVGTSVKIILPAREEEYE